jgi:Arc/MetJ-type ribon-helix-helix transcriptional regulator
MSSRRLQRVTYSLPEDLIDRVRSVVKGGAAPSYSAFVEQALAARVRLVHEEQLAVAFRSAAADPEFLADVEHSMSGFDNGDAETT